MGELSIKTKLMDRTLRGSSLLETIVASMIFLLVFTWTLGLLPRLTIDDKDLLHQIEAEFRVEQALERYGSGLWPDGQYSEHYAWGQIIIQTAPYRNCLDFQLVIVRGLIEGIHQPIIFRKIVERGNRF